MLLVSSIGQRLQAQLQPPASTADLEGVLQQASPNTRLEIKSVRTNMCLGLA